MSSSTVTYTSVYTDSEPWRFQWVFEDELEAPNAAPQSPGQAPPSPDYMSGPEHPPSIDYVPGHEEPEQASLSPDYPLQDDVSLAALSPGYVADSNLEEDPEEDLADYHAIGGDDDDDESSDDDDDNDDDEQEASKDDNEEEEEQPALSDSSAVPVDVHIPSTEDT
ncbi:hypothetical protein Tco_1292286 [Tanacetum coccineum]